MVINVKIFKQSETNNCRSEQKTNALQLFLSPWRFLGFPQLRIVTNEGFGSVHVLVVPSARVIGHMAFTALVIGQKHLMAVYFWEVLRQLRNCH